MSSRQEIQGPGFCEPLSHYVDAVRFGDLLFVSGITAISESGLVHAPGDVLAQAEFIFECLGRLLAQSGATPKDIIKVTVYLTDVDKRKPVNEVRKRFFGQNRPASTLIGVKALALPGLEIEVEAIVGLTNG